MALQKGDWNVTQMLLNRGADVNIPDPRGKYPVHMAVEKGDNVLLVALIDAGADLGKQDGVGMTPYGYALVLGNQKAAEIIWSRGGR